MSDKHYIDTIGVLIKVDVGENIVNATDVKLYVRKPDGTEVTWTPTIYECNYLLYITVDGDIDQAGFYRLQSAFTINGWTGRGNTAEFAIYNNYM